MNNVDHAISCFKKGFNCSQAIVSTYGRQFDLNHELALKISTAFGGGMAMGEVCGAVTGAFMVIGLKYGRIKIDEEEAREKTYELVREFVNRFKARNRTIICKKLLKCDPSTPEGSYFAKENNLFTTMCPKFVQDSAEIIEEIMKE